MPVRPVLSTAVAGCVANCCQLPIMPVARQGGRWRRAAWSAIAVVFRQRLSLPSGVQALHPRTGRTSHGAATLPGRSEARFTLAGLAGKGVISRHHAADEAVCSGDPRHCPEQC